MNDLGFSKIKDLLPPSILDSPNFNLIDTAFKALNYLVVIAAIIGIIVSGILFITAGGDPDKAAKAKNSLVWVITGIVIYMLMVVILAILRTILNSLGSGSL